MGKRWRRLGRWVGSVVLGLLLLCVVLLNGCSGLLARSIIWGPNTDRHVNPADDPSDEALALRGVDRQLRVDVGPPAASLSLWVVDPRAPAAPRGTVLVLHGINDRKDSVLGSAGGSRIAATAPCWWTSAPTAARAGSGSASGPSRRRTCRR